MGLVQSSVRGMAIAGVCAFVVLLIFTGNYVSASLALVSVAGVVLSVLATLAARGERFDATISISSVVLLGFSVDYTVMLAATYMKAQPVSRFGKMQFSLAALGMSILGGSITTAGAAAFLALGVILFFKKFALVMALTISYSLLWSLLFFPAAMMVVGPLHDCGSVAKLMRCDR